MIQLPAATCLLASRNFQVLPKKPQMGLLSPTPQCPRAYGDLSLGRPIPFPVPSRTHFGPGPELYGGWATLPEEACSSCAEQQGPTDFLPQSLHWPVWVYLHGLRCRWALQASSALSTEAALWTRMKLNIWLTKLQASLRHRWRPGANYYVWPPIGWTTTQRRCFTISCPINCLLEQAPLPNPLVLPALIPRCPGE